MFLEAWTQEMGLPLRIDGGADGDNHGVQWQPSTLDYMNGTRSSARTAYYDGIGERRNLDILVDSYAAKVIFDDDKAIAVDVAHKNTSETFSTLRVNEEVVLAAGAINTPKILQLSGIGPKDLLESHGIELVVDLPGVGANLQDHPSFKGFSFRCKLCYKVAIHEVIEEPSADT
jgi:choline dehydrogenase-like flavoprotein